MFHVKHGEKAMEKNKIKGIIIKQNPPPFSARNFVILWYCRTTLWDWTFLFSRMTAATFAVDKERQKNFSLYGLDSELAYSLYKFHQQKLPQILIRKVTHSTHRQQM